MGRFEAFWVDLSCCGEADEADVGVGGLVIAGPRASSTTARCRRSWRGGRHPCCRSAQGRRCCLRNLLQAWSPLVTRAGGGGDPIAERECSSGSQERRMPRSPLPWPASLSVDTDCKSAPPVRTGDLSPARDRQSLSFRPLAAVKATFFDAAIVIASPVDGLRP